MSTKNDQGDGAAASAFDRLFHRLVVAGDRPIVRKKKKKTNKKLHVPTPTPTPTPTPASEKAPPDTATHSEPVIPADIPPLVAVNPPIDGDAVACVRRLGLYRNARRLLEMPRDKMIQRLLGDDLKRSPGMRRRQRRLSTSQLSPFDCARRYIRLETIAARLYSQYPNSHNATSSSSSPSDSRVLHDFCFPHTIPFQSRVHYKDDPSIPCDTNVVPLAPTITWTQLGV